MEANILVLAALCTSLATSGAALLDLLSVLIVQQCLLSLLQHGEEGEG
jgi:hypothetical protein